MTSFSCLIKNVITHSLSLARSHLTFYYLWTLFWTTFAMLLDSSVSLNIHCFVSVSYLKYQRIESAKEIEKEKKRLRVNQSFVRMLSSWFDNSEQQTSSRWLWKTNVNLQQAIKKLARLMLVILNKCYAFIPSFCSFDRLIVLSILSRLIHSIGLLSDYLSKVNSLFEKFSLMMLYIWRYFLNNVKGSHSQLNWRLDCNCCV